MSSFTFDFNGKVACVEEIRVQHEDLIFGGYWKKTTLGGDVLGISLIRENLPASDREDPVVNQSRYATDITWQAKQLGLECPW